MVMPASMAASLHTPFDYKELPNQSIFLLGGNTASPNTR